MLYRKAAYGLLALSLVLNAGQLWLGIPQLPERVASHFDMQGKPDGFSSRPAFAIAMVFLSLILPVGMAAVGRFSGRLPDGMVNMPNKDYWLAPPRRETTLAALEGNMVGIAALTGLLMAYSFYLTLQANQTGSGLYLRGFGIALGVYLSAVLGNCFWLMRRFSRLPKPQGVSGDVESMPDA